MLVDIESAFFFKVLDHILYIYLYNHLHYFTSEWTYINEDIY